MEDLWKMRNLGYRTDELAEKAEYDRLLKRFRDEEATDNARNLLYGGASLGAAPAVSKEKKT